MLKINDVVTVNTGYVNTTLASQASNPRLRQTLDSLHRLSNTRARITSLGRMAKPGWSGEVLYYIGLLAEDTNNLTYHPSFDGPGRGTVIYFCSSEALNASFIPVD